MNNVIGLNNKVQAQIKKNPIRYLLNIKMNFLLDTTTVLLLYFSCTTNWYSYWWKIRQFCVGACEEFFKQPMPIGLFTIEFLWENDLFSDKTIYLTNNRLKFKSGDKSCIQCDAETLRQRKKNGIFLNTYFVKDKKKTKTKINEGIFRWLTLGYTSNCELRHLQLSNLWIL